MSETATSQETVAKEAIAGKFLTFSLGDEEYGVGILNVQEIIGRLPITRVPRVPEFIRGVINLRGRVIPIVDLRLKLGMPPGEESREQCMIVVEVTGVQMGLMVDRVSEVVDIPAAEIEDAPSFGSGVTTEYLLGIAKTAGKVRLLLDIERVLEKSEVTALQAVQAASSAEAES
ncbi:MAG TPA: chemotaxis protein CheW [Longimicrobiales bacterium]